MLTKKVLISNLNEYIKNNKAQYFSLYPNIDITISTIFSGFKSVTFGLVENDSDALVKTIQENLLNKSYTLFVHKDYFEDSIFFDSLPDFLGKEKGASIFVDSIVGNMPYYLSFLNPVQFKRFRDDLTVFSVLYQKVIFSNLIKQTYPSEVANQYLIKCIIICIYNIYRFIYGYIHETAKMYTIDLIKNSSILENLKKKSRININIIVNNVILKNNYKNFYEILFDNGLFTDYISYKNFMKKLIQNNTSEIIKILFTNEPFESTVDRVGSYMYKIIILSSSDLLQSWKQYSKFKRDMSSDLRTFRAVEEEMIRIFNSKIKTVTRL